jgi:hypothetical protein
VPSPVSAKKHAHGHHTSESLKFFGQTLSERRADCPVKFPAMIDDSGRRVNLLRIPRIIPILLTLAVRAGLSARSA